jgi:hypothetical protein
MVLESLGLLLAVYLSDQSLLIFIAIVLAVRVRIRALPLSLDLAQLGITQTLVPILRARCAERSLPIASCLPLSTCSTTVIATVSESREPT